MSISETSRKFGLPIPDSSVDSRTRSAQYAARGVSVSFKAIDQIADGTYKGELIERRIQMAAVIEGGTVMDKDYFYFRLVSLGESSRRQNQKTGRMRSTSFMEDLGKPFSASITAVEECFNAMRAEIVMAEKGEEDPELVAHFAVSMKDYLSDYSRGHGQPESLAKVRSEWDGQTIASFYESFERHVNGGYTLRTLPPYEVAVLRGFYSRRLDSGSSPSALDRLVAEVVMEDKSVPAHVKDVRERTHTKFNPHSHQVHVRALLLDLAIG